MGAISLPTGLDSSNSQRLERATNTTGETIGLSNFLLITFCLIILTFASLNLRWTRFRIQRCGLAGWSLSSAPLKRERNHTDDRLLHGVHPVSPTLDLPLRRQKIPHAVLSTIIVPLLELPVPQVALLIFAATLVGFASFVDNNWIYGSTRTGYIAITLVPCVIGLGNKVLGVGTVLQVGYTSVNWAHRWLGRILFVVTTSHVIAYLILFARTHSMRLEMSRTSNILATFAYTGLCLIFFSSIGKVRRHWWHIFKLFHHFGIFLFLLGLNYHSKILRPWVVFSVATIGLSALLRVLTSRLHIAYLTALPNAKSTIIHFPSVRSGWIPGQSVRIRVLTGGMGSKMVWESHPFTIACAPSTDFNDARIEGGAKLVVKAAGDWTNMLFKVASRRAKRDGGTEVNMPGYPVAILIEGPYGGNDVVYSAYGSILLAAGGSGVSYLLGVASTVIQDCRLGKAHTRHLHLVWTVRDRGAINDLLPNFQDILEAAQPYSQLRVTITLYFTSVSRGLIIRPFSILPNASMLIDQTSRRPRRSSQAPSSPRRTPNSAPPVYTWNALHHKFIPNSPTNPSSTALLGSGNSISTCVDLDRARANLIPRSPLAADRQFVISPSSGDSSGDSDDELGDADREFGKKEFKRKLGEDPFADDKAPPPPSPSTKHWHASSSRSRPSIETRPGRPEYNQILQNIIEIEQAYARGFGERFAALSGHRNHGSASGVGRIAVGACGPPGMVANLRSMCWDADGVEFHAEQFSL